MRETILQSKIRAVYNRRGNPCRVWRNNVGVLDTPSGGKVAYGLAKGSADLIGIRQILITPDMVGQIVGVFLSDEIKVEKGRVRPDQVIWRETIERFGGTATITRSEEEAEEHVRLWTIQNSLGI